jgi:hypothetical protein
MTESTQIKTGLDSTLLIEDGADVTAFADDGEYATVWVAKRVTPDAIHFSTYRCEAGRREQDGGGMVSVTPDRTTRSWANAFASENAESGIKNAKEYFNQ